MRDRIRNDYFNWLYDIACGNRYAEQISYRKLLMRLHAINFKYTITRDRNRGADGKGLRYRFGMLHDEYSQDLIAVALEGPCSVLEMMLALAIRCEEDTMDDPNMGNRTGQWFWGMVRNLGLSSMSDERFDKAVVDEIISRFLARRYEPDGKGGLFTVKNCDRDMRTVEIWHQLCWYLDSIT